MKPYITCAILLFQFASAARVININNAFDHAVKAINTKLTHRGLGVIPLPPQIFDDIQLYNGFLAGYNSLKRTKDATVTLNKDETNVSVDIHFGRGLYTFFFGLIKFNGDEMTGVFSVKKNSIHFSFTLINQTHCQVKLNKYEYETLTDATFDSTLPKYNGDVSEAFEDFALQRINEILEGKKPLVEKGLQGVICTRDHHDFNDASYLSEVLSQAFMYF